MFKENFIYLRKTKKITQEKLAKDLKVSRQTISKWENGEVVPDSYNLIEISKYFSIKVQDLIMTDLSEIYDVKSVVEELPEEVNIDIKAETQIDKLIDSQVNKKAKIKSSKKKIILILVLIAGLISIMFSFKDQLFSYKNEVIIDEPIQEPEETLIDYSKLLSAGREFSVYIDQNGKVVGFGDNTYKQLNVDNWSDIVQISAGGFHTLGLKSDGTVVATGYNNFKQIDVGTWSNIKQVSGGRYHSLGLKEDGTVLCVGENQYGAGNVSSWSNIIQVSAGRYNSYGLKSDGSVVSTENNEYGQANITTWSDIKQISSGTYQVLGLKSDGSVVCAGGQKGDGVCNVSSWSDIKQVVGAGYHSIGLKNDGTVVAVGNNERGQLDVSGWKDVVAVSGGRYHTIGLTKENQFLSLGLDEDENKIITGEEDNNPDDNDNEPSKGEKTYKTVDGGEIIVLETEERNTINEVKYSRSDYQLDFVTDKSLFIKAKCSWKLENNETGTEEYITYLHKGKFTNSFKDYLFSINECLYGKIQFSLAETTDEKSYTEYYKISTWIVAKDEYSGKDDFKKLFLDYSTLDISSNYDITSNFPGRLDISENKNGENLDLSYNLDYSYHIAKKYEYPQLNIKTVLTNYTTTEWASNIPDNFELNKTYYACNSVHNPKEDTQYFEGSDLITKCTPFTLSDIRLGLRPAHESQMQYGTIKYGYSQIWMSERTDGKFKITIEVPEFGINYDYEVKDVYTINIIDEIDDKITFSSSAQSEFKVYVKVVAKGVGNYLSSDPYEFTLTLKKLDFTN